MSRIVCLICDEPKRYADVENERRRLTGNQDSAMCLTCGQRTPNRHVADDNAVIAPGSALHFAEQRELYQRERAS